MTMDIATLGIRVDATEARLAAVELDRLGAAGGRTATAMSSVERASKNLMGVFAGLGLGAFAKDILATNREMETLRASLKSVTGSAASATAAFNSISEFAKNTPFEISGLTKTFITLQNMGIKPTQQVMEALTNQASKLGGSQETLTSIAMQLGQAHSKGKLQMEDMVVLMERGVPVMKLLGEVTGKNAAELADMSAKGTITIDMIDKLIIKMGEAASGSNAIAMETLNGKISSLSDAWHVFEDTLLNDKSEGFLKSIVADWTIDLDLLTNAIGSSAENQIAHMKDVMTFYNHLRGVIGLAPAESKGDLAKIKQLEDEITANKKVLDSEKEQNKVVQESLEIKKAKEKAAKDAAKAEEAQSKEATKAQEALNKSFASTLESLSLHNIELSKTTREHKEAELSAKGYTQAMVAQALALYDIGTALEAKKKLHEAEKSELDSLIDKYNQLTLSARDYKLTQLNAQGITGTDQAPIMAQFDKNTGAETAKKAQEDAKTTLDSYNKSLDDAKTKTSDLGAVTSAIFDGALGGINLVAGAFDSMVNSIAANTKALEENAKAQELNKSITDPKEKAANFKKYAAEEQKLNAKTVSDQITGASQMAGAAAKMFNQKSAAAKGFHAIEIGLSVLRLAMDAKEMASSIMKTGTNIMEGASKMFGQSGWFAFAGVAAMLALMAGLGFGSKGGGGGSSTPPPSDTGTGTVLGDPTAVSESIGKTNDLLKSIHASEYVELRGINRGINNLKGAISTTLDHLFQTGGMANFQPIAPKAPSVLDQLNPMSGGGIGAVINTMRAVATGGLSIISDFIVSKIPILGSIMSSINRFFFGGKVTQSVVGQGIGTNATSLQSVIDGGNVSGYQYADIKTHTSGGLFTKSKDRYSTQYQALSSDTQKSFNDIFSSVGDTIVGLAGTLGKSIETDLMPRVRSAIIPAMRVDLKGLNGEDASKKLNGVISAMMDTMTTQIFGDIVGKYQKLGESMLETTVRMVSEIVIVQDALKQSGLKLLAADVIAVSDAIVQAAGGLEAFQQQFESFFDKFYSDSEKQTRLQKTLVGSLAEANLILPTTRENYKKLVEGLNMTNPLDQQRYSLLLELSSAADTYYSMLEKGAEKVAAIAKTQRSLDIQYMELTGDAVGALTEKRKEELAAMDASLRITQQGVYILTDANKAVADATTAANKAVTDAMALASKAVSAAVNDVSKAISNLSSLAQKLRGALTGNTISTDATTKKDRADAQAVLNAALKVANAGGSIDNFAGMDKALTDISKPSEQLYATFTDYARDQALTSGTITQLADYAEAQVSMAQQQIDAINNTTSAVNSVVGSLANLTEAQKTLATVEDQKAQIEKMLGNNLAVLSVSEAINQLAGSLNAQNAATKAIALATAADKAATKADLALIQANTQATASALVYANAKSDWETRTVNANTAVTDSTAAIAKFTAALPAAQATYLYWANMNTDQGWNGAQRDSYRNSLAAAANNYTNTANSLTNAQTALVNANAAVVSAAAAGALLSGLSDTANADRSAADAALVTYQTARAYANATAAALPAFASGGQHEGGWRIVGENGPELEKTGASRIFSNPQSKSLLNMDELIAEIQALRSDVRAGQQAIANNTLRTAKILRDVTQDGTAITTVVAA